MANNPFGVPMKDSDSHSAPIGSEHGQPASPVRIASQTTTSNDQQRAADARVSRVNQSLATQAADISNAVTKRGV